MKTTKRDHSKIIAQIDRQEETEGFRVDLFTTHDDTILLDFGLQYNSEGEMKHDVIKGVGTAWLDNMIGVLTDARKFLDDKYPKNNNYSTKNKVT